MWRNIFKMNSLIGEQDYISDYFSILQFQLYGRFFYNPPMLLIKSWILNTYFFIEICDIVMIIGNNPEKNWE